MLRGTLGQDIDTEVDLVHLLVILLLIFSCDGFTLALKLMESVLKVFLLFLNTSLDDFCSHQEALLEILKGLILDMNGTFFVEFLVLKTELLQDWQQVVLQCFILGLIHLLLLVLFHFVSGFLVYALL